jgi:protein ImuA
VLFWLGALPGMRKQRDGGQEYAWLRRLQMAAESGRAMAVFFRSSAAERLSTPAHLRVVLSREAGALRLRIPKRRGPPLATPLALDIGLQLRAAPTPASVPRPLALVSAALAHSHIAA